MSAVAVLDTSALLAYLAGEAGAERIERSLDAGAAASTLMVQETVSKLVQRGMTPEDAASAVADLGLETHDLTFPLAVDAGALFPLTRRHGLSHGDRACLVLARRLGVPAVTADKAWSDVAGEIGVRVEQFR